jgi:hypothetical protein
MIGSEEGSTHSRATNALSKEQLNRAEQVKIMHNALQHISDDKLISALTCNTIVGSILTPRDFHNARRLFRPCLACVAGRTRRSHYTTSENETAQAVGDVVHAEIYILNTETIGGNKYFLVSLDEFSG